DAERVDRGRDIGGALARWQDALLLHERQRHREAAHLGRADVGWYTGADLDRRRHRDVATAARIGEAGRGAVLRRGAAGVRRRRARGRGKSSTDLPDASEGLSRRRARDAPDRGREVAGQPRYSQPAFSAEGPQAW